MKQLFLIALSVLVSIQLSSQISFTVTPTLCKNDTTNLVANTGSLPNCTYTWACSPNTGVFSSQNNSITNVTFSTSTIYTISLSVISGTIVANTQNTLSILQLPNITLTQSSQTTCITSNFPLYSNPVNLSASGGTAYIWNPPYFPLNGDSPNGPLNTVRPSINSCFSVTGVDANGCKAKAIACVTVIPRYNIQVTPVYTLICRSMDIDEYAILVVSNPSSPAYGLPSTHTYSWTGGVMGGILTTPFSKTVAVSPSAITTFTAEMHDSLHCASLPAIATVDVENCNGISENAEFDLVISIYPNPVNDKLFIQLLNSYSGILKVKVMNAFGKILSESVLNDANSVIDFTALPSGIYFLKVEGFSSSPVLKILKN